MARPNPKVIEPIWNNPAFNSAEYLWNQINYTVVTGQVSSFANFLQRYVSVKGNVDAPYPDDIKNQFTPLETLFSIAERYRMQNEDEEDLNSTARSLHHQKIEVMTQMCLALLKAGASRHSEKMSYLHRIGDLGQQRFEVADQLMKGIDWAGDPSYSKMLARVLHSAVDGGDVEYVRYLLEKGANPNMVMRYRGRGDVALWREAYQVAEEMRAAHPDKKEAYDAIIAMLEEKRHPLVREQRKIYAQLSQNPDEKVNTPFKVEDEQTFPMEVLAFWDMLYKAKKDGDIEAFKTYVKTYADNGGDLNAPDPRRDNNETPALAILFHDAFTASLMQGESHEADSQIERLTDMILVLMEAGAHTRGNDVPYLSWVDHLGSKKEQVMEKILAEKNVPPSIPLKEGSTASEAVFAGVRSDNQRIMKAGLDRAGNGADGMQWAAWVTGNETIGDGKKPKVSYAVGDSKSPFRA